MSSANEEEGKVKHLGHGLRVFASSNAISYSANGVICADCTFREFLAVESACLLLKLDTNIYLPLKSEGNAISMKSDLNSKRNESLYKLE